MKDLPLSYIEISRENLIHNIKQFRGLVKRGTHIVAVVKANAYGHGDTEVVKIIAPHVDYFQVDDIEELERICKITKKPILVLGYLNENGIRRAIQSGAVVCAFDFLHLLKINHIAKSLKIKTKVHLVVDSYLGREGILPEQLESLIIEVKRMKHIEIDGVYSHFANIEDTKNPSHARKQKKAYAKVIQILQAHGYTKIKTHISATSGVLAYEKDKGIHNLVRLGVGVYGMWPSERLEEKYKNKIILKPIVRWVTHVAQVKVLPKGHSIGYGLTFITKRVTTIAVVPQGYSDGIPRLLSNRGKVLVQGKEAKILGRISMNMLVVDVSHIKNVSSEDEVVILGNQKGGEITAEELARMTGTINYEVTTRVSPLLPRVIV